MIALPNCWRYNFNPSIELQTFNRSGCQMQMKSAYSIIFSSVRTFIAAHSFVANNCTKIFIPKCKYIYKLELDIPKCNWSAINKLRALVHASTKPRQSSTRTFWIIPHVCVFSSIQMRYMHQTIPKLFVACSETIHMIIQWKWALIAHCSMHISIAMQT